MRPSRASSLSSPLPRLPGWQMSVALAAALVVSTGFSLAESSLEFTKSFSPDTIGPGSVSTLTFTIGNTESMGTRDAAFTDVLPAGVVIATPANANADGAGSLSAPDGGSTIAFSDGQVGAFATVTIAVDVTCTTAGTATNTSGPLTSSLGTSDPATAELTVDAQLPGFSQSFAPSSIGLGGRATLTFTIDNSASTTKLMSLGFSDTLPPGMVIANPANASTTCGGASITATPGGNTISVSGGMLDPGTVCTVSVDVRAEAVGDLVNVSGELTGMTFPGYQSVSCGKSSDTLAVLADQLVLTKSFTDDPVPPGGTVTLEFTILNRDRDVGVRDIQFTDDLDAVLRGLTATGLPMSDVCGSGSVLSGTSMLTLTGGSVPAGGSRTFSVSLEVPAEASAGAVDNATSSITGVAGGNPITCAPAHDTLFITRAPFLTKEFIDDPVTPGGTVTLRFTLSNRSPSSPATSIAFVDELPTELPSVVTLPPNGFCGAGSTMTFTPATPYDPARLTVQGCELGAGRESSFDVVLDVASDASTGAARNTTDPLTATVDGGTVTGNSATDDLLIVSGPRLLKSFVDDPVMPGDSVTLEYTLTHGEESLFPATGISFTDDLDAAVPGMVATNLPQNDICGPGSSLTGTSVVVFSGGVLEPGGSRTFGVTLFVPPEAPLGEHTSTSGGVAADIDGMPVMSAPASDDLLITPLTWSKAFTDDPVTPGGTVTLEFTIVNGGPDEATGINFVDNLGNALTGLEAQGLPLPDVCGAGSTLSGVAGNSTLYLQNGSVPARGERTFGVTVLVPQAAAEGQYSSVAGNLNAMIGGASLVLPPASDKLQVSATLLRFTKVFLPNRAALGETVRLEFTVTNLDPVSDATDIAFVDELPGGLIANGGPWTGICGEESELSGTQVLSFTRGYLPPGGECTFSVPVTVPAETQPGIVTNTTGELTGVIDGSLLRADPAVADLTVRLPFRLDSAGLLPDRTFILEWSGALNRRYWVEWSPNLEEWHRVEPAIRGDTEPLNWIDSGPPGTPTPPATARMRYYRVKEIYVE